MKTNKKNLVIVEMVGDKVYMKHKGGAVDLSVDVTAVFNFGMFIQRVMELPPDDIAGEYIKHIEFIKQK